MIEAWSTTQVYAAEAALMATLDPTPTGDGDGELMGRAVRGLAAVLTARLAAPGARSVVALVGAGNNGADALYAAARLARAGHLVAAVHGNQVHERALAAALAAGVVIAAGASEESLDLIREADVILDGIVGIGGRPGLPAYAQPWVAAIPDAAYVLAVDLPSGQDPSGEVLDPDGVFADETVTFSVAKPVHLLPPTEQTVGLLTVVDIGLALPQPDPALATARVRRLTRADVAPLWPTPGPGDDKYSRGVLGIIAGGESYSGAAVLACLAAVEAGVGMVRYVGTPTPEGLVRAAVPEAVHGPGQVSAWLIGPGLDVTASGAAADRQLASARAALAGADPVVLDAGGLDLLTGPRAAPTLLTPHAGECARLLTRLGADSGGVTRANAKTSRIEAEPWANARSFVGAGEVTRAMVTAAPLRYAAALADLTGATVLLKGSTTLIVSPAPSSPVYSQGPAPAWLATAGSGDVLAGLAGTLLAAGLPPAPVGALAALVHGLAADEANPGGPVRAAALAHGIPRAVAAARRDR